MLANLASLYFTNYKLPPIMAHLLLILTSCPLASNSIIFKNLPTKSWSFHLSACRKRLPSQNKPPQSDRCRTRGAPVKGLEPCWLVQSWLMSSKEWKETPAAGDVGRHPMAHQPMDYCLLFPINSIGTTCLVEVWIIWVLGCSKLQRLYVWCSLNPLNGRNIKM